MWIKSNQSVITPTTVMNANINSASVDIRESQGFSAQIVWSGTPTGSFKLQASSDSQNPTNWTDVTNSTYSVTASGNYMWNVLQPLYNFVRIVYTDGSSGSSTATISSAIINVKCEW